MGVGVVWGRTGGRAALLPLPVLSKPQFEGLAFGMVGWGGSSPQDLEVWVLVWARPEQNKSRMFPRGHLLGQIPSEWFVEEWG